MERSLETFHSKKEYIILFLQVCIDGCGLDLLLFLQNRNVDMTESLYRVLCQWIEGGYPFNAVPIGVDPYRVRAVIGEKVDNLAVYGEFSRNRGTRAAIIASCRQRIRDCCRIERFAYPQVQFRRLQRLEGNHRRYEGPQMGHNHTGRMLDTCCERLQLRIFPIGSLPRTIQQLPIGGQVDMGNSRGLQILAQLHGEYFGWAKGPKPSVQRAGIHRQGLGKGIPLQALHIPSIHAIPLESLVSFAVFNIGLHLRTNVILHDRIYPSTERKGIQWMLMII